MTTNTWIENVSSIRLYRKCGFIDDKVESDRPDGSKNIYFKMGLV